MPDTVQFQIVTTASAEVTHAPEPAPEQETEQENEDKQ